MSGGTKQTTETRDTSPWGPSQDYLKSGMSEANRIFQGGYGFQPDTTSHVVPFSDDTVAGMGIIRDRAGMDTSQPLSAVNGIIGSGGLNDWQTKAMGRMDEVSQGGGAPSDAFNAILDRSQTDAQHSVNQGAAAAGRYGGAVHQGNVAREVADVSNRMRVDDQRYREGRADAATGALFNGGQAAQGNVMNAVQAAPGAYNYNNAGATALLGLGQMNEDLSRRAIDDRTRIIGEYQNQPLSQLNNFMASIGGAGQLGGSSTTASQQPQQSPFLRALGGAAALSPLGPYGAVVGGALGAFG